MLLLLLSKGFWGPSKLPLPQLFPAILLHIMQEVTWWAKQLAKSLYFCWGKISWREKKVQQVYMEYKFIRYTEMLCQLRRVAQHHPSVKGAEPACSSLGATTHSPGARALLSRPT
ncbi:uncharacterized protein LOC144211054 [Stigmatopora nigra]